VDLRELIKRFLQLAGDLIDRGVHLVLDDDGLAADHGEPCLVSCELLSHLMEFLARKSPAFEPLRGDTDAFRGESG
jgi:hypothetical protein